MKVYNLPIYLVINSDQRNIHLVPSIEERTWDVKEVKDVKILGLEDKRQIICVVSSTASGEFLPLQLIFIDNTNRCLPKYTEAKIRCLKKLASYLFS